MLKKLMAIILVLELGLMYLPEKYIFASEDDPQAETEETTSEEPTISTIPEMSGIEENTIVTEPVTDVVLDEAPVKEETPMDPTLPTESTNTITPLNDLPSADKWFVFDETTNTITGYSSSTSAPKNINIPSTIGGIPVYNIADNAFAGQQLTGLTLPNGLKTIGISAFQNNPNMAGDLVIPDSVTSIGTYAFDHCSSLISVTIGNGVTTIESYTFSNCSGMTSVIIGNGVINIMDEPFYRCENITNAIIGNSVTTIGSSVFAYCHFTSSLVIPDSVTTISDFAFPKTFMPSIKIPSKNEGEIEGEPWAAEARVYWKGVEEIGDYVFNTITNTIIKYSGTASTLDIPSAFTVNGISYPVKIIDSYVFQNNTALTTVTIPDGVTSLGQYVFSGCSNLTSAIIGHGLTSIENNTFSNCSNLTSVIIPDSVTIIKYDAFNHCSKLINIVIPNSVTSIENSAFGTCSGLTGVTFGNSVTEIGAYAFDGCSSLTNIIIPDSVTSIDYQAFANCNSLTTVTIHGSGKLYIAYRTRYAFLNCRNLKTIDLPERLKNSVSGEPWGAPSDSKVYWKDYRQAGDYVFNPITNSIAEYTGTATTPMIPSAIVVDGISYPVQKIDSSAFRNNSTITNITIPDSVTSIDSNGFYNCSVLTKIDIPSKNEGEISGEPWGAPSKTKVYWKDTKQVGDYLFSTTTGTITKYTGTATTVNIPTTLSVDGIGYQVKKIGNCTFEDKINITNITIPNSITVIGYSAFNSCSSLKTIVIPDSVTSIGNYAFSDCSALTTITIGSGVTSIGPLTFFRCNKLNSIFISSKNEGEITGASWGAPNSTNVYWKGIEQIGDYLFNLAKNTITKYIGSATTLIIPSDFVVNGTSYPVKMIGNNAFRDNSVLNNVTIPDSVTDIGDFAFKNSGLTNATIGNGVTSIGTSAFESSKLTNVTIGNGVTSIGSSAFAYCNGLTRITIPDSVTDIGRSAFLSSGLTNVTIGNGVTSIGESAFSRCYSLNSIVIPNNVTSIGSSAFSECSALNTATIGNGVIYINESLFNKCSSLTDVKLGNSIEYIGYAAFQSCSNLTGIIIPSSVKKIKDNVFHSCSNLTTVTIHGSGKLEIEGTNDSVYYKYHNFNGCSKLKFIDLPERLKGSVWGSPWGAPSDSKVYWKDYRKAGEYMFNPLNGEILKYEGTASTLVIPSTFIVDGISYPVKAIGTDPFPYGTLTSITIPDSVTSIGAYAFHSYFKEIHIPGKNEGEISGAPWRANYAAVYWKHVKQIGDYAFNTSNGAIAKYLGTDPVVTIPSYFTVDDTDYPVKAINSIAFYDDKTLTKVTIPDSVTSIGESAFYNCSALAEAMIGNGVTSIGREAFQSCESLTSIVIPDSVISIGDSAFNYCKALTEAAISKNITSMASNVFGNTPALQTIYMRASRSGLPISITSAQPWGAPASSTVWYAGDTVTFNNTVKKVTGKYNRIIDIRAFLNKPALINRIILPNGTIKYIAKSDWPDETGYYPYGNITEEAITSNGTYVFKGYGDDNVERSYAVEINDIGIITLRANEASITEQMAPTASEQDVLDLLNVSAEDDAGVLTSGTDCTFWISPEDMNKIHVLHLGDVVTIRVNVKSSRSGKEMTSYRDVTLNTTSCVIHADNVDLWPPEITSLTKEQLLDLMHVSVTVSEGIADITKLVMSDEDFNKIKTGTIGTYNVLLTYDTNKAKKRVRVTIMDDSPAVLIKIPNEIKMNTIEHDPVYGVGADETVSIQPFTNTTLYPNPFKVETEPIFWLRSTAPDATGFNRMKVVVLDANDQPLPDNHLLATLSGTTIQSAPFKLRGYHNEWNSVGTYSGIMNFLITYEELMP